MNKDDNIEILDTSGKVDSTTTLNSQKTSTSSDMQGNPILSELDSPSVPVPSNDYFTSNTTPNVSSVSSEVVQPNFQTLDSMSNAQPNVQPVSPTVAPSSPSSSSVPDFPSSSTSSVASPIVQPGSASDTTASLAAENKYRASNHAAMDNFASMSDNRTTVDTSSSSISTANNVTSALGITPASSNRQAHIPDLSKRDRMSAFFHSSDTTGSDTGSTSNNAINNQDSNNNSSKSTKPVIFLIIFILLLLVIVFLPNIGELFSSIFPKSEAPTDIAELENGSLTCTLEHEEEGISYFYTDTYDFENREVENLQHVVSIQAGTDFLNQRNMECQTLKQAASNIRGISIDCNLSSGEMVETQNFNFSSLKDVDISTEFVEAGGIYPNVEYGDDISDIEKNLTISGYECSES